MTEGQPPGHAIRACIFGMHLAAEIRVPAWEQADLYYALLMKDAGCSSNSSKMAHLLGGDEISAKRDVKTTDWTRICWESVRYALAHVQPKAPFLTRIRALVEMAWNEKRTARELVQVRCERGAAIARKIGLSERSATAIYGLDELWNGQGHPEGLRGREIPLFSRILNLAQTLDVFYVEYGREAAIEIARRRSGRWFDPALVRALESVAKREQLWIDLKNAKVQVLSFAPQDDALAGNEQLMDDICHAFAEVIDAKSPFTYRHSTGVAEAAMGIGNVLTLPAEQMKVLYRASLLHDVGKLGVSNTILDKPDKLDNAEWKSIREHPRHSFEILSRIPGFEVISDLAGSHHEKLDGSGYYRNRTGDDLCLLSRILTVADIYDALAADRPYREGMPIERVLQIIGRDAPKALDENVAEALNCWVLCRTPSSSVIGSSKATELATHLKF